MIPKSVEVGAHTVIDYSKVDVGKDSKIGVFVEIRDGVTIGENCLIDSYCCFTGNAKIGNNVVIRNRCTIARGVEIGDNTIISPHCVFQNMNSGMEEIGGAKIGKNCFIGTGVVFKEGVTVCDGVTIGSNSYVNKDITRAGVYFGSPARRKFMITDARKDSCGNA